ncbi:phosphoenolpyruvate synthase [Methanothermobacter sp. KEPCO-1]|uniref:Predicted phosphoenolpyruvate synthase n=1 Tax=Methanothermobacter marburgensis (strain ATCC BAA-927 / DSM 2133 / JCM 14651 / NBRC 100331 / OCM 82 / Marburg) TaxID=79929 RepID=D9PW48_METTM|nr:MULTISPECIES: putative PEP-binding protein [Methanothermobacter]ADL58446.1 predicted phosphoenolpyruvate synthase [Methanothermobacter marburgensis str. Marburg]QEF93703.1 phosphoenolpyruvate synthase [Methanothermobacter sp. KEPCO-1]WBF10580.1 phosphoenolpyruvate synthase [Methanothermobacter marburgensis]
MQILRGVGAGAGRRSGKVRIIRNLEDACSLEWGEVAVFKKIARDMLPEIKRAAAVIADYGGLTSHAAITLRELGIPCVLGTEIATRVLREGMIVTVDGKTGNIYRGVMDWASRDDVMGVHETATKVMVNLNFPWLAARVAEFADGVGSVRIENMVIETGKHPYLLLKEGELSRVLERGLEEILEAFHPKPVCFRTFDIPTDELTHLRGYTEPQERNPFLGMRAIKRDLRDTEVLKAEFEAVSNLLDSGYSNLELKFPFIRDIPEYVQAVEILDESGIRPHRDLRVGASIETPSMALQIDELLDEGVDFVSLGLSDLTMCSLAADRRSTRVAGIFNLSHPAVLGMVEEVVVACHERCVEVYAAGYAATNYVLVRKLVEMGVDAVSTSPDKVLRMRSFIAKVEDSLILRAMGRNS